MRRTLAAVAVAAMAFTASGCGHKNLDAELKKSTDAGSKVNPGDKIQVEGAIEFVEPTQYHEDIGLRAIADGNRLAIYIRNSRKSDFFLSPTDFGVILLGEKKLIRVESGKTDFRHFPYPFNFQPGATTAGLIVFRGVENLAGGRLVFNNPEIGKPFFVPIESAAEARAPKQ